MLASFLCATTLATSQLTMPDAPIGEELILGRQIARRGHSLDAVYMRDRDWVGRWFNGSRFESIESVIWLSPRLLSRWLGYLNERECWPNGEIDMRWSTLRRHMGDSLHFIVSLRAYPKSATLDLVEPAPARTSDLFNLSFAIYPKGGDRICASRVFLGTWQVRDRSNLDCFRWWLNVPFGRPLTPKNHEFENRPAYHLGDYFGAWYWVAAKAPQAYSVPYDLYIYGPNKLRTARFNRSSP